ncbi:AlpA family transcriptional regulator [Pseudoalteromonas sp. A3]|uniref:helix-turn-helix transcriptional regulator n=1 Tax=Pseudoalteromonas sp. A3 TaxID=142792 RepID=UPI0029C9CB5D|nr:AlpA family transcriptional regulator [Pseudoalteromonas sp. A3]
MNKLEYDLLEKYLAQLSFRASNAIRELQQVKSHIESFQSQISKRSFVSQSTPKLESSQLNTHKEKNVNKSPNDLIRMKEVVRMTGLSRSTLYRLQQLEEFPKAVNLGCRSVAWVRSDINDWIREKVQQ